MKPANQGKAADQTTAPQAWFEAASHADLQTLGRLLPSIAIDSVDARGYTALFRAVAPAGGDLATAGWLIDVGADVHIRTRRHESLAVHAYAHADSTSEHDYARKIVRLLRESGFKADPSDAPPTSPDVEEIYQRWADVTAMERARVTQNLCQRALAVWDLGAESGGLASTAQIGLRGREGDSEDNYALAIDPTVARQIYRAALSLAQDEPPPPDDILERWRTLALVIADPDCTLTDCYRFAFLAAYAFYQLVASAPNTPSLGLVSCFALAAAQDWSTRHRWHEEAIVAVCGDARPPPPQAKPTQAKPTQAKPTQAKPTQAKPTNTSPPTPSVAPSPAPATVEPMQSWPIRASYFREGLVFTGYVLIAIVACFALGGVGLLFIEPRHLVELMILMLFVMTFAGMPGAYFAGMRHLRRPRKNAARLQLHADRIEIVRPGQPTQVFLRDESLTLTAQWFEGIAGERVFMGAGTAAVGRGYTAVIYIHLSGTAAEVLLMAEGGVEGIYAEDWSTRLSELGTIWPGAQRVRLWPEHLIAFGRQCAGKASVPKE